MNHPTPTIRVTVDVTNPGQFFACCGLLELADRLWPGAEGWFEEGVFCVGSDGDLRTLISILSQVIPQEVTQLDGSDLQIKPLIAPLRFVFGDEKRHQLTIDAWTTIRIDKGQPAVLANPPWNFWSGQQTSLSIWSGLQAVLVKQLQQIKPEQMGELFSLRVFQKGRFGFDPGPAWNALDVGFSPNEQNMEVESSATVELLAAIGIQRFRPNLSRDRQSFDYAMWTMPLSPAIAAAAMCGALHVTPTTRFRCSVVSRGQYAALGVSFPLHEGISDE